ncbi:Fur family transcriptional regulator [Dongshaea marina]|uniref:Fur family transcriptional regulator n=1 Tax=Dongshaea marina TaxID=2047966 RepID=UPI000D3E1AFB|nr:transcriptional repressor [Dongshaea marina]
MNRVQKALEHAEQKCRNNGGRLTSKRKLVLSGLLLCEKAMSAYELVDFCQQELGEVIPAMSVYRILEFLQQQQLVHKLNLANKYVACCHISCSHSHEVPLFLICGKCQRVKEISLGKITEEELKHDVEQANFQLVSPQLELNCVCDECSAGA